MGAITIAALASGFNPVAAVAASPAARSSTEIGDGEGEGSASDRQNALLAQADSVPAQVGFVDLSRMGSMPPRGPLSAAGDALSAYGISPRLLMTNIYVTNPSTGINTGKWADYFTGFFGVDVDLQKLVSLPNTQLHFTESWEPPGHNTEKFTLQTGSAFTPLVPVTARNNLIKFTLSHDFFDKRLRVEYGRMNLTDDFFVATMCAGCIVSTPAITELGVPGPTKSVWGARLAYTLSPHSRFGLGVLEDNSTLFRSSSGWDWSTKTRTGYSGVANYTYTTDFADSHHPLKAEAGIYHSTTPYSDALYNTDGSTRSLNPMGTALKHKSGTWGVYGHGRKVVWADGARGLVPENVAVYGGALVTPGAGQSFPLEAYGGVEYGGFLKDNPATLVGATIRYIQLSSKRAKFEQELSTVTGNGSGNVSRDTFSFDLHAQHGIAPGVLLNGFAQYILNPNRMHGGPAMGPTRSGWMFGVALLVDLGRLTGLASGGPP
jgi:porin